MKIFGVLASLLITGFVIGQKSYYFSLPLHESGSKVITIDEKWQGIYRSKTEARSYEVTPEGIYVISTTISSIGRDAIRESSQYDVRNKMIFGVIEGDSLPCVLKDDRYYFGVKNKDVLVGGGSSNRLIKLTPSKYILNYFENGLYTPALITIEKNELIISDFDYDFETTVFDGIQKREVINGEHHDLVILTPTKEEFEALLKKQLFGDGYRFKKSRK